MPLAWILQVIHIFVTERNQMALSTHTADADRLFYSNRMLKKSVQDFFSHDLAGVNPSKSCKSLDF